MRFAKGRAWMGWMVISLCLCLIRGVSHADEDAQVVIDVNLFATAVLPGGVSILVGDRGKIFLSDDGARTWRTVDSGTEKALVTVCFPEDRNGWVAGQSGVILHSTDAGKTWEPQSSGVDAYLLDIDFIDPQHGFAVGADSTVVMTTDGGRTWERSPLASSIDLEEEFNLFAVTMLNTGEACTAGDGGRIFRTEDAGNSWVESKSPLYDEETMEGRILYSIAHDAGVLYAVGIDGALVISRDGGRTWVERETGFAGPELYSIDVVDGLGVAAGSGGHVLQTSDGGLTWHEVEVPERVTCFWLSGVALRKTPSGDVHGLIVGQEGTFGHLENGVFSW
jgi:photosystem II stability/assembly factor-like uncharacterized protein